MLLFLDYSITLDASLSPSNDDHIYTFMQYFVYSAPLCKCQAMVPPCIHPHVSSLQPPSFRLFFQFWLVWGDECCTVQSVGLMLIRIRICIHPELVKYTVYKIRIWFRYSRFHLIMDHRPSSTWMIGATISTATVDTIFADCLCTMDELAFD